MNRRGHRCASLLITVSSPISQSLSRLGEAPQECDSNAMRQCYLGLSSDPERAITTLFKVGLLYISFVEFDVHFESLIGDAVKIA
jgi:hypothetical protein